MDINLNTVLSILSETVPEAVATSAPVTCCGEWTWDGTEYWVGPGFAHLQADYVGGLVFVCNKCHRALLADGEMTGPLVEVEAVSRVLSNPLGLTYAHTASRNADMLDRTWGTT
jgi:hypothetical protein